MKKKIQNVLLSTTFAFTLFSLVFNLTNNSSAFAQSFLPINNPSSTIPFNSPNFGCMNNGGHFPPGLIGIDTCPSQTMDLLPIEPLETLCLNPSGKHIPPGLVSKESCPPSMASFPPANFPPEVPMDPAQFLQTQSQSLNTQSLPFQFPMDNSLCQSTSTFENGLANGQYQEQPCLVNHFFLLPQQSPTTTTSTPLPSTPQFAAPPTAAQNPFQQHDYGNMVPDQFIQQIAPFNLQLPTN